MKRLKYEDKIDFFFKKNNMNITFFDKDFLKEELKTIDSNLQKTKHFCNDSNIEPIFSHDQVGKEERNVNS